MIFRLNKSCFITIVLVVSSFAQNQNSKIVFWNTQRKGANWFNQFPTKQWLVDAKNAGIEVVRLAPNKWKSKERDFLIGNADHYSGIVEDDFQKVQKALNWADSVGIKIVVTTLSLPGSRWRQQNGNKFDLRLWKDSAYVKQSAHFWKDLAGRLKKHPAVVGYNILNEPIPELSSGIRDGREVDFIKWYATVQNTPADLNKFNSKILRAIREVDSETPVVIDGGLWAESYAIGYLKPLEDENILYAVHMYEPFDYTNFKTNNGRYTYPSRNIPWESGDKSFRALDSSYLQSILAPVAAWQKQHAVSSNRIVVSEFGCNRRTNGAARYLNDLITIFDDYGWHWMFYAFREDGWDGMDYEMGTRPAGEAYWNSIERGETPKAKRGRNELWDVIKKELRK